MRSHRQRASARTLDPYPDPYPNPNPDPDPNPNPNPNPDPNPNPNPNPRAHAGSGPLRCCERREQPHLPHGSAPQAVAHTGHPAGPAGAAAGEQVGGPAPEEARATSGRGATTHHAQPNLRDPPPPSPPPRATLTSPQINFLPPHSQTPGFDMRLLRLGLRGHTKMKTDLSSLTAVLDRREADAARRLHKPVSEHLLWRSM